MKIMRNFICLNVGVEVDRRFIEAWLLPELYSMTKAAERINIY